MPDCTIDKPKIYRKVGGKCLFCGWVEMFAVGIYVYGQYDYTVCRRCARRIFKKYYEKG